MAVRLRLLTRSVYLIPRSQRAHDAGHTHFQALHKGRSWPSGRAALLLRTGAATLGAWTAAQLRQRPSAVGRAPAIASAATVWQRADAMPSTAGVRLARTACLLLAQDGSSSHSVVQTSRASHQV